MSGLPSKNSSLIQSKFHRNEFKKENTLKRFTYYFKILRTSSVKVSSVKYFILNSTCEIVLKNKLDLFDHLFREVVSLIETGELFGSSIHLTPAKQFPHKKSARQKQRRTNGYLQLTNKQWMHGGKDRMRE